MGFIGPNGAGKSTTIKLIMNLIKKDDGEIKVFDKDHLKHEREIKEKIGFVYDENNFYEELTLIEMKKIIAPFYQNFKYGYIKTKIFNMFFFFLFFLGPSILASFIMENSSHPVSRAVMSLGTEYSRVLLGGAVFITIGILILISLKVSFKFYEKREF